MSSSSSSQRDFSFFSLFTAGLACLVPFANAYTKPVGAEPKGNPISQPGLNSVVPAGENFTVTWQPTTSGTVTLVLLKGPSTDAIPQYAIAEKIENSGSYVWTPSTDLAPQDTGYGLQLIVDATGQYQYTTQFGISNADYNPHASHSGSWSSSWASSTASATSSGASSSTCTDSTTSIASTTGTASTTTIASTTVSETISANGTSSATTTTKPVITSSATIGPIGTGISSNGSAVASTGGIPANSSIVYPTGSMSVPTSLKTTASVGNAATATGSSPPIQTGAAAGMATSFAGLVVAAGVAVFAL